MEWLVKNALSRDTEREHLNKILAEIRKAIDAKNVQPTQQSTTTTTTIVKPRDTSIILTGDVVGQGKGTSTISIATTLATPSVEEAPKDGHYYWRLNGEWESVPPAVLAMNYMPTSGMVSWDTSTNAFSARTLQGALDQIIVMDGDGVISDPTISLAPAILERLPGVVPSLVNADTVPIVPGSAIARIGSGYVLADRSISDRWNVVGLYIGDIAVPVGEELKPRVDGIVQLTALQWDDVLGTIGGLATGMSYFLGTGGSLTVIPPSADGEYNVVVGLAITSTELHIRDMRPVKL